MSWNPFKKGTRTKKRAIHFLINKEGNKEKYPELTEFDKLIKSEKVSKSKPMSSILQRKDAFYVSPEPETRISSSRNYEIIEGHFDPYVEIKGISTKTIPEGTVALGLKKRSKTRKHNKKHKTQKRHKKANKKTYKKSKTYKKK
jgi:hypothetical protein